MNKYSIKSLSLKGSLSNGMLKYNFAKNELKEGIWQISIREFGYVLKANTSTFVQFSTNVIKDLREKNYTVENFMPAIGSAKLEGKTSEKIIVYFEPIWFQITTPDKEICLYFRNPFNEDLIINDCDVFVTILLQRLQ
jgi:hypothetical protein